MATDISPDVDAVSQQLASMTWGHNVAEETRLWNLPIDPSFWGWTLVPGAPSLAEALDHRRLIPTHGPVAEVRVNRSAAAGCAHPMTTAVVTDTSGHRQEMAFTTVQPCAQQAPVASVSRMQRTPETLGSQSPSSQSALSRPAILPRDPPLVQTQRGQRIADVLPAATELSAARAAFRKGRFRLDTILCHNPACRRHILCTDPVHHGDRGCDCWLYAQDNTSGDWGVSRIHKWIYHCQFSDVCQRTCQLCQECIAVMEEVDNAQPSLAHFAMPTPPRGPLENHLQSLATRREAIEAQTADGETQSRAPTPPADAETARDLSLPDSFNEAYWRRVVASEQGGTAEWLQEAVALQRKHPDLLPPAQGMLTPAEYTHAFTDHVNALRQREQDREWNENALNPNSRWKNVPRGSRGSTNGVWAVRGHGTGLQQARQLHYSGIQSLDTHMLFDTLPGVPFAQTPHVGTPLRVIADTGATFTEVSRAFLRILHEDACAPGCQRCRIDTAWGDPFYFFDSRHTVHHEAGAATFYVATPEDTYLVRAHITRRFRNLPILSLGLDAGELLLLALPRLFATIAPERREIALQRFTDPAWEWVDNPAQQAQFPAPSPYDYRMYQSSPYAVGHDSRLVRYDDPYNPVPMDLPAPPVWPFRPEVIVRRPTGNGCSCYAATQTTC